MVSRCADVYGVMRCQGASGHAGAHWADVGRSPAVLRWGMVGYGCHDPECIRLPGHSSPHRNGKGMSWAPMEADTDDPFWSQPPRPRGLRWVAHVMESGGLCLVRCPHYGVAA